jgi:hypothetical protein
LSRPSRVLRSSSWVMSGAVLMTMSAVRTAAESRAEREPGRALMVGYLAER